MKLVTYSDRGIVKLGAIKGDGVIDPGKHIPAAPAPSRRKHRTWTRKPKF